MQDGEDSHGYSNVEGDDFKDKVNDLIIAFFMHTEMFCGVANIRDY